MALLNECCSCDKMFKSTKKNSGSICPECLAKAKKEANLKEKEKS